MSVNFPYINYQSSLCNLKKIVDNTNKLSSNTISGYMTHVILLPNKFDMEEHGWTPVYDLCPTRSLLDARHLSSWFCQENWCNHSFQDRQNYCEGIWMVSLSRGPNLYNKMLTDFTLRSLPWSLCVQSMNKMSSQLNRCSTKMYFAQTPKKKITRHPLHLSVNS